MNSNRLTLFAGCVAGAALLWGWYLLSRQPDATPARPSGPSASNSERPEKTDAAAWPARGTPELRERLREPAARWLNSRGRDAAGLIAIRDLCRDPDILNEAASRFPNEPIVCRAMVESCADQPERALFWIEKLIAAEPKNPDGYYLKAWALFSLEDNHAAIAALYKAVGTAGATSGPRFTHLWDRSHVLLLAAALSVPDRVIGLAQIALFRDQDLNRRFYDDAAPALTKAMDEARQAGILYDIAGPGTIAFQAVESLFENQFAAVSLNDEISANRFQRAILAHIPDDWKWFAGHEWRWDTDDIDDETAAELKLAAEKEGENLASAARIADLAVQQLRSASEEVSIEYHKRYFQEGQRKANDWLLKQREPASK